MKLFCRDKSTEVKIMLRVSLEKQALENLCVDAKRSLSEKLKLIELEEAYKRIIKGKLALGTGGFESHYERNLYDEYKSVFCIDELKEKVDVYCHLLENRINRQKTIITTKNTFVISWAAFIVSITTFFVTQFKEISTSTVLLMIFLVAVVLIGIYFYPLKGHKS